LRLEFLYAGEPTLSWTSNGARPPAPTGSARGGTTPKIPAEAVLLQVRVRDVSAALEGAGNGVVDGVAAVTYSTAVAAAPWLDGSGGL
jgi:hypothetical protein